MPDKSPLKPGHILLISKIHLRCHADARPEALAELDEVAVKVRRFLKEAYRTESLVWENGVSGQSVYHAHLHLLPAPINNIPPEFDSHGDVTRIEGWQPVRERFARHGSYLYAEYRGGPSPRDSHRAYPPVADPAAGRHRLVAPGSQLAKQP